MSTNKKTVYQSHSDNTLKKMTAAINEEQQCSNFFVHRLNNFHFFQNFLISYHYYNLKIYPNGMLINENC